MVRHFLIGLCAVTGVVSPSAWAKADTIAPHRSLALAVSEENAARTLGLVREVRHQAPDDYRNALECMEALLEEIQLAEAVVEERAVGELLAGVRRLVQARNRCEEEAPSIADVARSARRRAQLDYLIPELEHADELMREAAELIDSEHSPRTRDASAAAQPLERERRRLSDLITSPERVTWSRVQAFWDHASPPPAVPAEWGGASMAPPIATFAGGVLLAGISFLGSVSILWTGRRLHELYAGGWGLAVGLLSATVAAVGWEKPRRWAAILGTLTSAIALGGGVTGLARRGRNGRYFGRGLIIGGSVGLALAAGSWAHIAYHRRADDRWRRFLGRRVAITPTGTGLALHGRF